MEMDLIKYMIEDVATTSLDKISEYILGCEILMISLAFALGVALFVLYCALLSPNDGLKHKVETTERTVREINLNLDKANYKLNELTQIIKIIGGNDYDRK